MKRDGNLAAFIKGVDLGEAIEFLPRLIRCFKHSPQTNPIAPVNLPLARISQGLNFGHYVDVLKRRIFYFLLPFGLVSILGLYFAAILKPNYLSEGKILVETQRIAPDLVRPIVTATANERIQVIQQRILTRDNLLSIASKFGLFPGPVGVLELMRESTQIKPVRSRGAAPTRRFHNRVHGGLRIRKSRDGHESGK